MKLQRLLYNIDYLKSKKDTIMSWAVLILVIIAYFDIGLAVGLLLLVILTAGTFMVLYKIGFRDKQLYLLLTIALLIHLSAALFINYANFQPFGGGGGGFKTAHLIGKAISENFKSGNFSLEGVSYYGRSHDPYQGYSLLVGILYTITLPKMIIGQLFNVWLSMLLVLTAYLIMLELDATPKLAFLTGVIISVYPSYIFYGSLLLKDGLVATLVLLGLFLTIKLIKYFSIRNFAIFFIIVLILNHLRFYVNYALILTFSICFILLSNLRFKKKVLVTVIIIPLIGLSPHIFDKQGFFGWHTFNSFFNKEKISFYHQKAYQPPSALEISEPQTSVDLTPVFDSEEFSIDPSLIGTKGYTSTWKREEVDFNKEPVKFLINYSTYFSYVLLGPFPFQFTEARHYFALFETLPWYVLCFFIIIGIYQSIKSKNKIALPLLVFSILLTGVMLVFISNFGIITRIRIPVFIALLCFIPFAINYLEL